MMIGSMTKSLTGLLLPPYDDVENPLPAAPALFILTRDPLWDWLFFVEAVEGEWQITALMMVSRESGAYPRLLDRQILWP